MREPRFTRHGMFAALGVGNQMIAVLPKSDIVIVNRANTYQGEGTPMPALLDLIEQVLEARTDTAVSEPTLVALEVGDDPQITVVAEARLAEFVGTWDFPPAPLGLDPITTVEVKPGDGHLVAYSPVSGTFKLYLQPDGSLHEEDSYERYLPVRTRDGSFAGMSDVRTIAMAAIMAATEGTRDRAEFVLSLAEGEEGVRIGVARAVVELLAGRRQLADRLVREVADRTNSAETEGEVNAVGYVLMRSERLEQACSIFELNTRVFPDAYNTWDSLGEALMTLGRNDEAISAYEKSLELNPENENARTMIARIRGGGRL